jgi:hypothetical protein
MSRQVFDPAQENAGHITQIASGRLFRIGGAAASAGAVLVYLGYRDAKKAASPAAMLVPDIGPQRAGAQAVIQF